MTSTCHCGHDRTYQSCCQPMHLCLTPANSPEQLMRSRYSAFCCGDIEYLINTTHPSNRAVDDAREIQKSIESTQWHRLQVIDSSSQGDKGSVEFTAFFTANEKPGQLHEKSAFIRENNLWYYFDGEQCPPVKLQRNEPCWCGSGKKLKKCCTIQP